MPYLLDYGRFVLFTSSLLAICFQALSHVNAVYEVSLGTLCSDFFKVCVALPTCHSYSQVFKARYYLKIFMEIQEINHPITYLLRYALKCSTSPTTLEMLTVKLLGKPGLDFWTRLFPKVVSLKLVLCLRGLDLIFTLEMGLACL